MPKQPFKLETGKDSIDNLLPEFLRYDNHIMFLLNQIKNNIGVLSSVPIDNNSHAQYQMWQKTAEYILTLREVILVKHQKIMPNEEELSQTTEHQAFFEENLKKLNNFIESGQINELDTFVNEIKHHILSQYPIPLYTQLAHHLAYFQGSRIPALTAFYDHLKEILEEGDAPETQVKQLQQAIIDFYYKTRKLSGNIERWLFRESRESKLANALESFINENILFDKIVKIPHRIKKDESPPDIDDLLGESTSNKNNLMHP